MLEDGAVFENFCEMKNSTLGPGSKVKHLTYLGDVTIGTRANVGAGTVFDYDGQRKHPTVVEDGAFVDIGSLIIGPNRVPEGATTALARSSPGASMGQGRPGGGAARRLQADAPRREDS